jgi:hypothetical protein
VFQLNGIKISRIACRRADGLPAIGVAKTVGSALGAGGIVAAVGAGGDGDRMTITNARSSEANADSRS